MKRKYSVCLDALYMELPFDERIRAAKQDGFDAIEFWDRRDKDPEKIRTLCDDLGITITGFNGDAEISMVDPDTQEEYLSYLGESVQVAKRLNAKSLTIHSNGLGEGGVVLNSYDNLSDTVKTCTMFRTLIACAKMGEENGVVMNLEPLNVVTDHVGNYLQTTQMAAEMIRLIRSPYLKVLYDVYHMYLNEGCLEETIRTYGDTFGHVHIADAPGRHEIGTGEIPYPQVFETLEEIGYSGYIGLELFPKTTTAEAVKAIRTLC